MPPAPQLPSASRINEFHPFLSEIDSGSKMNEYISNRHNVVHRCNKDKKGDDIDIDYITIRKLIDTVKSVQTDIELSIKAYYEV